jgi:hypothetical protein
MTINGKDYTPGMFRGDNGSNMVTHLYHGDFNDPGFPMCSRGWQRKWYNEKGELEDYEYSIFRNVVSSAGLCSVCMERARKGLPAIEKPASKKTIQKKTDMSKHIIQVPFHMSTNVGIARMMNVDTGLVDPFEVPTIGIDYDSPEDPSKIVTVIGVPEGLYVEKETDDSIIIGFILDKMQMMVREK